MTGVEAVSNGVQAFREPVVASARKTLTLIVAILILLLMGVAYLVQVYHINATDPGSPQYQSILSMITQAVIGRGIFYFLTMAAVFLVLCLSANTSFADFPRVCRTIALDGYLPYSFTVRGRRLVFTEGALLLTGLSGLLLIFQRSYRPVDPSLRGGSVSCVHFVASRHGDALAKEETAGSGRQHYPERNWSHRDRHHLLYRHRHQIRRRRVGRAPGWARFVPLHVNDTSSLREDRRRARALPGL